MKNHRNSPPSVVLSLASIVAVWIVVASTVTGTARGDDAPSITILRDVPGHLKEGVDGVREVDLRAWVGFLAAPELEGREAGTRGYDVAAAFCESVFRQLGVKPAGDAIGKERSYRQKFTMLRIEQDMEGSFLETKLGEETTRYELGRHFSTAIKDALEWSGHVVFLGSAAAPLASPVDLADRIVLVLRGQELDRGKLEKLGARRVLALAPGNLRRYRGARREMPEYLFETSAAGKDKGVDVVWVSEDVADRLLGAKGLKASELAERLGKGEAVEALDLGIGVSLVRKIASEQRAETCNVAGLIEGADKKLKEEYVVVGAHLDHVGAHDDKIFFGADDDASGSSGVLALGRAFTANSKKPKRSVLLLLYGAEEKGLRGSKYFVDHPTVPLDKIVAKINLDMIGRDEDHSMDRNRVEKAADNTNAVHLVGSRRKTDSLHRLIVEQNRSIGLEFDYDEEERVWRRSDQFHFSEAGIPVAFFFTGFHPDYHKPTDTPDKLNYGKMTRIVRLVYMTAHSLANLDGRLKNTRSF